MIIRLMFFFGDNFGWVRIEKGVIFLLLMLFNVSFINYLKLFYMVIVENFIRYELLDILCSNGGEIKFVFY